MNTKYVLHLHISTDEDATLIYDDTEFCWYGQEDLIIRKEFDALHLLAHFIDTEIKVKDGGKATRYIRQWLQFISFGITYDHKLEDTRYGNQELHYNINVINPPEKPKTLQDIHDATVDQIFKL